MFVDMAVINPHAFVNHLSKLKHSCEQHPANLALGAKIIGPVGKTNKVRLNSFIVNILPTY